MPNFLKPKIKLHLSLTAKLVLIFIIFSILPIVLIGYISVSRTTQELTNEATIRLNSLAKAEAEKINLKLAKVDSGSKNLADLSTNIYNNPQFFNHPEYWSTDHLFQGSDGQWGNEAGEPSSMIVFNWQPLDETTKTDLNLSANLDFIFPSIRQTNPNVDNIYIIGNNYGWYRFYPNSDPDPDKRGGFAMDVLAADMNKEGVEPAFWDDLDETRNPEQKVKWTPPYVDVTGHGLMVSSLAPIYRAQTMVGLAGLDLTLEDITNRILDIKLWKTGYAFLIDQEARPISLSVRSHADLEWKEENLGLAEIRKFSLLDVSNPDLKHIIRAMQSGLSGLKTIEFNPPAGGEKYIAYYPIQETGWSLGLVVPVNEIIASAAETQKFILFILCGLAGVLIILILLSLLSVTKPIKELTKGAKEISKGNLLYQIKLNTRDEIEQLADSFNQMARELQVYYATLEQKVKDRTQELALAKGRIEQEKNRLEAILVSMADGVFVIDTNKKLALINPAVERITGFTEKDCLGKIYSEIFKFLKEEDKTENTQFLDEILKTGGLANMANHTTITAKDGRLIPVASSAAAIKDENKQIIAAVVVFRDITKEREMDRIKSEFVSLASHQLRTPVTIIKWGAEMLLKTLEKKLEPKETEQIQRICRGSEKMVELVNDLLNVSRLESGRLIFKTEEKQLEEIVDAVAEEYKPYLEKKKQKLSVAKPEKLLPKVKIDPEKMRQVIIILLDNAIKYSPENTEIKIKIELKDNEILYSTSDQGLGIPKAQQDKIFQRFFRADNVSQQQGTGLGLYLAKGLVEAHKGKLWFESEEGKGTTFYFTLSVV